MCVRDSIRERERVRDVYIDRPIERTRETDRETDRQLQREIGRDTQTVYKQRPISHCVFPVVNDKYMHNFEKRYTHTNATYSIHV